MIERKCNAKFPLRLYWLWTWAWFKEGSAVPLQFRSPSNSGLQGSPFQPLNIIVYRSFESPFYKQLPALYGHPPFYIFFKPPLLVRLFRQYRLNEIPNKHKNKLSCGKVISSSLEDLKTTLNAFFINNTFISNTPG